MFPMNFVVGALVGVAGTYVAKDEPTRERLLETTQKIKAAATAFVDSLKKPAKTTVTTDTTTTVDAVPAETVVATATPSETVTTTVETAPAASSVADVTPAPQATVTTEPAADIKPN